MKTNVCHAWLERMLTDTALREKMQAKLDRKLDKSGGPDACWPFKGTLTRGYGLLFIGSKMGPDKKWKKGNNYTHRIAYVLHNRRLPDGGYVCHRCDNPPCCNPAHLFAGTQKDNVDDMLRKKRAPRVDPTLRQGERNGSAKYTSEQALAVVALTYERLSQGAIRERLGVSRSFIEKVRAGKSWSSVTGLSPGNRLQFKKRREWKGRKSKAA